MYGTSTFWNSDWKGTGKRTWNQPNLTGDMEKIAQQEALAVGTNIGWSPVGNSL
jgi:hypothetical protein